ncbi:MAG TPA: hypothetical protein VHO06_15420 [Polyangia bacterium]|nr:hypothetical protein [Polyangia bacterium]
MSPAIQSILISFPMRALAFPAADMPGQWIAISLDLDIMAQGSSAESAAATLRDSLLEMIAFRLSQGMPPIEWRKAPEEFWVAAEAEIGESLDRAAPEIGFSTVSGSLNTPDIRLAVTKHAPVPVAHAG